jgi:integrase
MSQKAEQKSTPWNKGKSLGQKQPFTPQQARMIRDLLEAGQDWRDLALFNVAVDTMLRASDLLKLKVEDVSDHTGAIVAEFPIQKKKRGKPHVVMLSDKSKRALEQWIKASGKWSGDYLFTRLKGQVHEPISRRQYANIIKGWAKLVKADPKNFSTHSGRRTKSVAVYQRTQNIAACQELLGQKSLGATASYLGVGKRQALDIAKTIDI